MKQILFITSDTGGASEDYNPFYSRMVIVSSDTLPPLGNRRSDTTKLKGDTEVWLDSLRTLGYTVEEPDVHYVEEDLEWEEDADDSDDLDDEAD